MTTACDISTDNERIATTASSASIFLIFQVAEQSYAIPVNEVEEIVPMAELSHPPGSPALLAGLLNVGGTLLPVIQLSVLFGAPLTPVGIFTPLVILRRTDSPLALLVDRVNRMAPLSEASILPIGGNHCSNGCAIGSLNINGETILVLSTGRILLEQERQCVASLTAQAAQRVENLTEAQS